MEFCGSLKQIFFLYFHQLIVVIILDCLFLFLWYRNWELVAPWTGTQIKVPVKFIVGDLDLTYNSFGAKDYVHKGGFKRDVPFLEEVVIMEGVGHFINQERPEEISKHIYDFFSKF